MFKPTEAQLKEAEPINPLPLEDTPLVLVETEEQLQDMVTQLKSVSEFAVDLEVCLLNSPCTCVRTYVHALPQVTKYILLNLILILIFPVCNSVNILL